MPVASSLLGEMGRHVMHIKIFISMHILYIKTHINLNRIKSLNAHTHTNECKHLVCPQSQVKVDKVEKISIRSMHE